MKVIKTVAEMAALGKQWRREGKSVGLVPTMGYLHEGHISLAKEAVAHHDIVVMSIFVNPIQFGAGEDLKQYPRDMAGDKKKAAEAGVDFIFAPKAADMYPKGFCTVIDVKTLTTTLCGVSRQGHFQGVAVVVSKLFHLVQPDAAYFGQKDGQQLAVIRRMVADLNMPLEIVGVPIVREADGLALSSRNVYLDAEAREQALVLSQSLMKAKAAYEAGERECSKLKIMIREHIATAWLSDVEYVEIVDADDMQPVEMIDRPVMVAMAVRFNGTRLIDNLLLGQELAE